MNDDILQVLEKLDALSARLQGFIVWAEAAQNELYSIQQTIHKSFQKQEGE